MNETPQAHDSDSGRVHGESAQAATANGVTVGVDGSEQSLNALDFAAQEAIDHKVPLNIVTAYSIPVFAASSMDAGYASMDDDAFRAGALETVQDAATHVRSFVEQGLEVRTFVESGDAAGVLLDFSEEADLMVVGRRGRGGFMGRLLGSVSAAIPAHSKCPTLVVPLTAKDRTEVRDVIVVGVDGSERARLAVLKAADRAIAEDVTLRVICAIPPLGGSLAWVPATIDQEAVFRDLRTQLDAGERWLKSYYPNLKFESDVVEGSPVEVLIDESRTAKLLVTGSRGRGGFAGMLLGSTSQGVLFHANGPVMVVPDGEDSRLEERKNFN
ncbi:universal stress protein [Neomicrococcus aestuarii]|uniref:Nucleotide-binding universal stress UspA family protein n=1 Tax=Neomicrococcus aestuarii TaxID=556325 RepID=A0A7W8TTJ1_9MICC|nr:universal stress protein [Neomicrococcus aestuarii]MBB5512652.1 nucleotide-binding universal stress UspA family protein [Neomicrococcus aestuarii]